MIKLFARQYRAINICFVLVFVFGFISLSKLGREELPEFGGEGLNIYASLPGATPAEMDREVARLLNNAIVGLPGVDEVRSDARDGFVTLSVSLKNDEIDVDGLRREIAQLATQVPDLPVDLEGPFISRQFDRLFPPITLLFKGGDDVQRHNAWLKVEQILLALPEIDALEVLGDRERRIEVRVNPITLSYSGMRLDELVRKIRHSVTDSGAGKLRSKLGTARIRTFHQPVNAAALGETRLSSNSGILPVSYFADVVETLAPEEIRVIHDDELAWYINIYRRQGSNVTDLSLRVQTLVSRLNAEYENEGSGFRLVVLHDRSGIVTRNLAELTSSIILGMGIVFLILWIFLGTRNAIYAAIGIPFSFFAAFIAMDLLGLSINTLTLFGLVLVCGMVVDDAIVVIENIDQKMSQGFRPIDAVVEGLKEVAPAVTAATGTTVAVFMPLMLMSGGMGMFISQIPKVAILALIASLVECFVVLPIHLYAGGRISNRERDAGAWRSRLRKLMIDLADFFAERSAVLVRFPYRSLAGFVVLFLVTSAIAYQTMDFKLFEATETRSIKLHVEFDQAVDIESGFQLVRFAMQDTKIVDPRIKDIVLIAGFRNFNYQKTIREHLATVEVLLTDEAVAQGVALPLADALELKLNALPGIKRIQVSLETNAPPTGLPVQIFLYGEDTAALRIASRRVREALASIASIRHISDPMEDGVRERVFKLDSARMSYYGLDSDLIARLLRTSITGIKVGKVDRGSEVIDIYVTTHPDQQPFSAITRSDGSVVPLNELGEFVLQTSAESIYRFQGLRYVSITAEVDEEVLSVFKTHREIETVINDSVLMPGVTFDQQGEFSDTQKSLASMIQAGLIGLGLSYFILTLLFRSFLQPIVVLLAIPLAYMGVVWGMTLTGQPLSLIGFIGVVGLMGIVINDSLVWVNFYNRAREQGISPADAAVQTVKQRFRPIWLTTITTVGGLLPVSISQSAGIANAMANTLVYGLVTASFLLLLFLPVCVVALDDVVNRISWFRQGVSSAASKVLTET